MRVLDWAVRVRLQSTCGITNIYNPKVHNHNALYRAQSQFIERQLIWFRSDVTHSHVLSVKTEREADVRPTCASGSTSAVLGACTLRWPRLEKSSPVAAQKRPSSSPTNWAQSKGYCWRYHYPWIPCSISVNLHLRYTRIVGANAPKLQCTIGRTKSQPR